LASGESEEIGGRNGKTWLKVAGALRFKEDRSVAGAEEAAELLIGSLERERFPNPSCIGHRLVHGGPKLREHQLITPDVMAELERAIPFAPLHVPVSLKVIKYARKRFPDVPNVACFDTVFHRTLPDFAYRLPLPKQLFEVGVFRYGFHGLSFEYIVDFLGTELPSKTVVAHLGNGVGLLGQTTR
jgi:acetate kinase